MLGLTLNGCVQDSRVEVTFPDTDEGERCAAIIDRDGTNINALKSKAANGFFGSMVYAEEQVEPPPATTSVTPPQLPRSAARPAVVTTPRPEEKPTSPTSR